MPDATIAQPAPSQVLIVAAVEEELIALRNKAAAESANTPSGLVAFASIGCGVIEAAVNMSALLSRSAEHPQAVVFVGSAGSYDRAVPLLSAAIAAEVRQTDSSVALHCGYFPGLMQTAIRSDLKIHQQLSTLDDSSLRTLGRQLVSGVFGTPLAITSDRRLGKIISREIGVRFENLELFGLAAACSSYKIPWCGFSVITNYIYKNAHKEWTENRQAASQLTATLVWDWLRRTYIQGGE